MEPERRARVLVVDDSRLLRELARETLAPHYRVDCCESAEQALVQLAHEPADLVVSDLTMQGMSGIELLERVRHTHPGTEFVVVTAYASVETAVEALRMGAADYLQKPVQREHLAAVVERILSHQALVRENERLETAMRTLESCRTLLHCLDAGEVYAAALGLLLHAVGRQRGFALFHRTQVPGSDGVAFRGFPEEQTRELRKLLVDSKPLVDLDAPREIGVKRDSPLQEALEQAGFGVGPALVVPLRGGESEAGLLWIFEDGEPLGRAELSRVPLIAGHAQLALANAERFHRAKERAFVDDVTEVYNARYLLQATEHEIQRAERYGKQLCVLFLDLDRFKRVNDQYGHLIGSRVLRRLSEVLQDCIRQVDTLARYGGDEFTILLEDTPHDGGMAVAERIRRSVAETIFEGTRGVPVRLTISIGVATYPEHSTEHDGLLDLADKAMYRAKSLGRNKVCSAMDLV